MAEIPVRECPRTSENFCRRFRTFADWGCPRKSAKVHKSRECPRKIKKVRGSLRDSKYFHGEIALRRTLVDLRVNILLIENLLLDSIRLKNFSRRKSVYICILYTVIESVAEIPRPRNFCIGKSANVHGREQTAAENLRLSVAANMTIRGENQQIKSGHGHKNSATESLPRTF